MERYVGVTTLRTYLGLICVTQSQTRRQAGSFAERSVESDDRAAKALFGALDEMATNWILSKRRYDLSAESDVVVDLFVNGLKANT